MKRQISHSGRIQSRDRVIQGPDSNRSWRKIRGSGQRRTDTEILAFATCENVHYAGLQRIGGDMSGIRISDYTVANLVDALRSAIWQVPRFQREFVWDTAGIAGLATSIIDAYPIGMITLWEQSDRDPLDMERLSIQDYDAQKKSTIMRYFGEDKDSSKIYAILDGRQRCTACLLYTSPSPRDRTRSRMPSSA